MQLFETRACPCPSGARLLPLRADDGVFLRAAFWPPLFPVPAGTAVVFPGRAEFIEKYYETIVELRARGFAVAALDWRGQGGSARALANPRKGHVGRFGEYRRDLGALTGALGAIAPKPWFALAHSMGGAILIEAAAGDRAPFERIVATAPMLDLHGLAFPGGVRRLARALTLAGLSGGFIPGGGETSAMTRPFAGNPLTSDPARYARNAEIAARFPEIAIGDPTIGWLDAAFRAMSAIARVEFAPRLRAPLLIIAAGADRIVETAASERLAARLKSGRCLVLAHSAHEILMERDVFRAQFWAAFDAFVPGRAIAA